MDGVLLCARYAFAPNYYKYCGPDANRGIAAYLKEDISDPRLSSYLSEFAVLYPYLNLIAQENGIADPFDLRVVEAYWIGNKLLEKVGMKAFAEHLNYGQKLQKRLPAKKLKWIMEKVPKGARIHHSFHVFSIFTRTGHHAVDHTLETMDSCRISHGEILQNDQSPISNFQSIKVKTNKLVYENGRLRLDEGVEKEVALPVDSELEKNLKSGDWVTFHWGFVCDKVSSEQVRNLKFYTKHNLRLANETI
jgi:hydrogenase maturation factor